MPKSLTLYDKHLIKIQDIGSSSFFRKEHIGEVREDYIRKRLIERIEFEEIYTYNKELDIQTLVENYDLIIFTEMPERISLLVELNTYIHEKNLNVAVIYSAAWGLFNWIFVGFPRKFKIHDPNGKDPEPLIISNITNSNPGIVTIEKDTPHHYKDGDFVFIDDVRGMTPVNGNSCRPIKGLDAYNLIIEDTSKFPKYEQGGKLWKAKIPYYEEFQTFSEFLNSPFRRSTLVYSDPYKSNFPEKLFNSLKDIILLAIEYEVLIDDLYGIIEKNEEIAKKENFDFIRTILLQSKSIISPIASYLGCLVGIETIKFTGKYCPIKQLYVNEFFSISPNELFETIGSEHDHLITLFGSQALSKLQDFKILVLGNGSTGCEYLRNLAVMGVGQNSEYGVKVIDPETVKSKDRESHFWLQQSTSTVSMKTNISKRICLEINPKFKLETINVMIGKESDNSIREEVWRDADLYIIAIDNEDAKNFIVEKAKWYQKPLLNSLIIGLKTFSEILVPMQTNSSILKMDESEKNFENDTIRYFPYLHEHVIMWSKNFFEIVIKGLNEFLMKYKEDADKAINNLLLKTKSQFFSILIILIHGIIVKEYIGKEKEFEEEIIHLAFQLSKFIFYENAKNIRNKFPIDMLDNKGKKIWSGCRKPPIPQRIEKENPSFKLFSHSLLSLFSIIYNDLVYIKDPNSKEFQNLLKSKKIETSWKFSYDLCDDEIYVMIEEIRNQSINFRRNQVFYKLTLDNSIHFNYSLLFIFVTANLRGLVYSIPEASKSRVSRIAFDLSRSMFMSHSYIAGISFMEIFKLILNNDISDFRAYLSDPIKNSYSFLELVAPLKLKIGSSDDSKKSIFYPEWEKKVYKNRKIGEIIFQISNEFSMDFEEIEIEDLKLHVKGKFKRIPSHESFGGNAMDHSMVSSPNCGYLLNELLQ